MTSSQSAILLLGNYRGIYSSERKIRILKRVRLGFFKKRKGVGGKEEENREEEKKERYFFFKKGEN